MTSAAPSAGHSAVQVDAPTSGKGPQPSAAGGKKKKSWTKKISVAIAVAVVVCVVIPLITGLIMYFVTKSVIDGNRKQQYEDCLKISRQLPEKNCDELQPNGLSFKLPPKASDGGLGSKSKYG